MRIFLCLIILMFFIGCNSTRQASAIKQSKKELKINPNKEGEYEITVLDPGYEFFLKSKAYPINYFSKNYLASRNRRLVSNWNERYSQPQIYNPNIYEVYIDYNPSINYGLEFEWKLFNFFMFVEAQTGEKIDGNPITIQ